MEGVYIMHSVWWMPWIPCASRGAVRLLLTLYIWNPNSHGKNKDTCTVPSVTLVWLARYSDFHIIKSGSTLLRLQAAVTFWDRPMHRWLIYIPIIQQSASSPADLHLLVVALIMARPRVINKKVPNSAAFSESVDWWELLRSYICVLPDRQVSMILSWLCLVYSFAVLQWPSLVLRSVHPS
jgi:hypothetical protein